MCVHLKYSALLNLDTKQSLIYLAMPMGIAHHSFSLFPLFGLYFEDLALKNSDKESCGMKSNLLKPIGTKNE